MQPTTTMAAETLKDRQVIPVSQLLPYREFDRAINPAPKVFGYHNHTFGEIVLHVKEHGIDPIELSIFDNRALVTDGNHRLAAASLLGIKEVQVVVSHYENLEDLERVFYPHTIEKFKPVTDFI